MKIKDMELKIGLFIVIFIVGLILIGIFYTPYSITEMHALDKYARPFTKYLLGADEKGRDLLSRLMVGGRYTLIIASCTILISMGIGSITGLLCGYKGGIIDEIVMRISDAIASFPGILLGLILVTVINGKNYTIILALSIMFLPSFIRIVRMGALQYKNSDFVNQVRVFGGSDIRIVFVHILPNLFPIILSSVVVGMSNAILAESGMSYLGLGIQPPTPSWGKMLYEAQPSLLHAPWEAVIPGLVIMLTVIGFHCIGEGLRRKYC